MLPVTSSPYVVGRVGFEPTAYLTSLIYSQLPSPFGYRPMFFIGFPLRLSRLFRASSTPRARDGTHKQFSASIHYIYSARTSFAADALANTEFSAEQRLWAILDSNQGHYSSSQLS